MNAFIGIALVLGSCVKMFRESAPAMIILGCAFIFVAGTEKRS